MNPRRFFTAKAIGFLVAVGLIGGFFLFNNYIYQEKQGDGDDVGSATFEPYRANLAGEYVCLPDEADGAESAESDCEQPGIKTESGEYYAVNFYLMSQTHTPLEVGQKFSANGAVTPAERLSNDEWRKYPVEGIFSVTDSLTLLGDIDGEDGRGQSGGGDIDNGEPYVCTADVKLCPDGSYVGRQGPQCEFAACPAPNPATLPTEFTLALGEIKTMADLTLTPLEVVSDSRCPVDEGVQCIWAGIIEVRTALASKVTNGEQIFEIGSSHIMGDYLITLEAVSPEKTQAPIADDSYRFTYSVSLK